MFTKFIRQVGNDGYEGILPIDRGKAGIFGDSIFELIDVDNSGTLDYSEFVAACGHFWYVYKNISILPYDFILT